MADAPPVASETPPRAWLVGLILRDGFEAATSESFADAQRIRLRPVDEGGAEFVGQLPFEHAEQVWVRLNPRRRSHPWRAGWFVGVQLDGAPERTPVVLAAEEPVMFLVGGTRTLRVSPLEQEQFTDHEPLPLCRPVRLQDVAFGRRTRQSSATAQVNPFTAMTRWMTPTRAESRPWWELDTGTGHYIARIRVHSREPVPGTARLQVFTNFGPDGSIAASWSVELVLDGCGQDIEVDTVGRYVRIEVLAPEGEQVSFELTAVEIEAAPLAEPSLLDNLCRSFTLFADRPLFCHREITDGRLGGYQRWLSYREVWTRALHLATGLARWLEPHGDRTFVGICASGRAEWPITDIACVARNYVVVPLAHTDNVSKWQPIIDQCQMRAIVCSPGHVDAFLELAQQCPSLCLIVEMTALPHEQPATREHTIGAVAHLGFAELERAGAESDPLPFAPRDGHELYTLLYTSGSTGLPKGAMRSHDAFNAMVGEYGVVQPAIYLSYQPLNHLSERMGVPVLIQRGGQIGFASGDPSRLFEDIALLQPTYVIGVPRVFDVLRTQVHQLLATGESEANALASIRAIFGPRLQAVYVGSAPASPALLEFMRKLFAGCWMIEGYGTTEVGTIAVDGVVPANVDVKLVDVPELGYFTSDEPPRGEVCVRTPHMISGYFGDRETSQRRFDSAGYFHTGDIGQRNANGTIQVIGRRDHVIKLPQGEFVVPERIEAVLLACPLVDQIYVHARALELCVVAIVVPVPGTASTDVLRKLRAVGKREGLHEYELPAAIHLEPQPMTAEAGLLTSSNKPNRRAIEQHYQTVLDDLYEQARASSAASLLEVVASSATSLFGDIPRDAELATIAVDSLAGVQLVAMLQERLQREIPLDAWFASSSLEEFARRLAGERPDPSVHEQARVDVTSPLPFDAAAIAACPPTEHLHDFRHVLLTGATGFLGRGLLEALLVQATATITCLVRAASLAEAEQRLRTHLANAGVAWRPEWDSRVRVVLGDLAAPSLGLDTEQWTQLAGSVDAIIHAGAVVNWIMLYGQLRRANVLGTIELMKLATVGQRKAFHFVSTISTAPIGGAEDTLLDEQQALGGSGYGLSKWVAEALVRRAGELGLPVAIYRPGMIACHSTRGHANLGDFGSRYLLGCTQLGLHLDLDAVLDMTPVDFVSEAIVALSRRSQAIGAIHHLVNLEQSWTYRALGAAMRRAGVAIQPASYAEFRAALVDAGKTHGNALLPLLSYFPAEQWALDMGPWPNARTRATLLELGLSCPPVNDAMITAYLRWLSGSTSANRTATARTARAART
jgi:fatty acid CoA ligase FadD9